MLIPSVASKPVFLKESPSIPRHVDFRR